MLQSILLIDIIKLLMLKKQYNKNNLMSFLGILCLIFISEIYLLYTLMQIETFTPYNPIGKLDYVNISIVIIFVSNLIAILTSYFIIATWKVSTSFFIKSQKIKTISVKRIAQLNIVETVVLFLLLLLQTTL